MRVVLDRTKCGGIGIYEGLDPERFQVQSDGKAQVVRDVLEDGQASEVAQEAVESCPTVALRIVD
jgi:ferredoxin